MSTETTRLAETALVARTKIHLEPLNTLSGEGAGYYAPGDRLPRDLDPETIGQFLTHGSAEHGVPDRDGPMIPAELAALIAEFQGVKVKVRVEKYDGGEQSLARALDPDVAPDAVAEAEDNLLTIGGASILWNRLYSDSPQKFDNTNAYLGVGESATAAADTQTNLQGSTLTRKAMDATYPTHTDSTGTAGSKTITFKSTFGTSDANIAWNEWAIFNASVSGRMLNRKVESLGTKTSSATWVLTVTASLA